MIPPDIARQIERLSDFDVYKAISKCRNSQYAGRNLFEIQEALGDIARARSHLGQLMVDIRHEK